MIQIKDEVLVDKSISSTAKIIYGVLTTFSKENVCNTTIEQLSEMLSISIMCVRSNLDKLVSNGYIDRKQDTESSIKKYNYEVLK